MLEQIQAPTEDGRTVQLLVSLTTAAYGLATFLSAAQVVNPLGAFGGAFLLVGVAATLHSVQRPARTA